MSTADLERELDRWRGRDVPPSNALPLTVEDALAYRNAGNLPDGLGRTLRLVLVARTPEEVQSLGVRRALYELDYHSAPAWRREGSAPVNVVPLRSPGVAGDPSPWWESTDVAELEAEWAATGRVGDLVVPAEYRGFVFKTVLSLREAGLPVDADTVADSISRWLPPGEAEEVRAALRRAAAG
ncbi:MAG: hypothetical protein M3323_06835 [Actinomycetota bacterium]|nr:hypothetical protein [Actinomycetota bacterium]